MPDKTFENPIHADPSKFSLREEALDLKFIGKERRYPIYAQRIGRDVEMYIDEKTGERFYKINSNQPQSQKLMSLLLKGVINVSDIIRVGDDYYSHEQNFSNIEPSKENIIEEIEADLFIIKKVFGDIDHEYFPVDNPSRLEMERIHPNPNSFLEHKNLLVDETNKKLSFFDFNGFWLKSMKDHRKNFSNQKEMFRRQLLNKNFCSSFNRNMILSIIQKKVQILVNLYSNVDLERFKKILEKSEVKLNVKAKKILLHNIQLRLKALNEVLLELEPN